LEQIASNEILPILIDDFANRIDGNIDNSV